MRDQVSIKYMYPPLINDKTLMNEPKKFWELFLSGGESDARGGFCVLNREVPSLFYVPWICTEGGSAYPLHNTKFNFDERVLIEGAKAYLALAQSERLTVE
jgi:hypothetical protein